MDVKSFVDILLPALSTVGQIRDIALHIEGPVADGRTYLHSDDGFVQFFFNQRTGTLAFALVVRQQRIWGLDFDNRRGWHLHPVDNPKSHVAIEPLSVPDIVTLVSSRSSTFVKSRTSSPLNIEKILTLLQKVLAAGSESVEGESG